MMSDSISVNRGSATESYQMDMAAGEHGPSKADGKPTEQSTLIVEISQELQRQKKFHVAALAISWASVIFSLTTGVAGLVLGESGRSEALFAYGMDAILDSLSSVAVVWRFHSQLDSVDSAQRERKACIVIGVLFLVSSASLIIKGIYAILTGARENEDIILYESFALTCGVISVLIAACKLIVGHALDSQALATDSIITLVGAATCFAGVAGLELYVNNTDLWFMDSVFGIICGLFLLVFGIRLLYTMLSNKEQS